MILLIDANSLIHRCYHALPPLTNAKGEPTGALYGVASVLLKIISDLRPEYCVALFDRPEPTFRKEKFNDYKIHRKKADDELIAQIIKAHDLFDAFSIPWLELPGYEADDLIGTLATRFSSGKGSEKQRVRILTGDLDSLQLVRDGSIEVETFRKGLTDTIVYDEGAVQERYGIKPKQLIDYKALVGDASDNIPGVPNVGPKTASDILQKYGTLDAFFEKGKEEKAHERIAAHKEVALLSRELATIHLDAPVQASLSDFTTSFSPKKALTFFEENEFTSLIKRLPASNTTLDLQSANSPDIAIGLQLLGKDPRASVPRAQVEKELKEKNVWNVWHNIELPLIPVIKEMEKTGIRVDTKRLERTEEKLDAEIRKMELKLRSQFGDINFNSPKQVLEVLQKKFNLKLKSTAADALGKLADPPQAIRDLLAYRELFKLKTTYLHPLRDFVRDDGKIHPTFVQIGAATGRIACQNPNLQNIPQESEWSGEIRDAFIASEGCSLFSCDYSQIELRVLAHLTKDTNMMNAFIEGKDIHARTAAFIFGVSEEEVTKQMRRVAKTLNFGMVYGMGHRAFAQSAGIANDEAKKFMEKYFEEFATVKKWQEKVLEEARKKGYVQNENGRIRYLPDLRASNKFFASEAERAAINMPVQSLATADIIKIAMIKTDAHIRKKHPQEARLILTVHDELIFEASDALLADGQESPVVKDIQKIMESAYALSVPIATSASIGKTWKELG